MGQNENGDKGMLIYEEAKKKAEKIRSYTLEWLRRVEFYLRS